MPRTFTFPREVVGESPLDNGDGTARVVAQANSRKLWFISGGGAQMQTEVVFRQSLNGNQRIDINSSLRRTPYLRMMASRLLSLRPRHVLVLGFGGGLLPSALVASGVHVKVVESCAAVVELARVFMGAQPNNLQISPAEDFVVAQAKLPPQQLERFDACAIDVFEGSSSGIPPAILTANFHTALRRLLNPGGIVLQNALAHPGDQCEPSSDTVGGRRDAKRKFALSAANGGWVRCHVWARNAAPRGPLQTAAYPKQNRSSDELAKLVAAYREAYAGSQIRVHRVCSWTPSRLVECQLPHQITPPT